MTKSIDFYFDFISPYSYLAHKKIKILEKKQSIKIKYKPILLGGLHNLHGIKAPAFIPAKAKFMIRDCKLIAEKNKITFKFNSYFPIKTLTLMRGVLVSEEDQIDTMYIDKIFDAIWKDDLDTSNEEILKSILQKCKINSNDFFVGIKSLKIKDELKTITQEAHNKEIFGTPTFVVNNKIFWGQDRLEFALDEYNK